MKKLIIFLSVLVGICFAGTVFAKTFTVSIATSGTTTVKSGGVSPFILNDTSANYDLYPQIHRYYSYGLQITDIEVYDQQLSDGGDYSGATYTVFARFKSESTDVSWDDCRKISIIDDESMDSSASPYMTWFIGPPADLMRLYFETGSSPFGTADGILIASEIPVQSYSIDATTGAKTTIDYAHHEIHGGSAYETIYSEGDVDSGETVAFTFVTPDSAALVHMLFDVSASAESGVSLLESPTIISNGSARSIFNNRRGSDKTSGCIARLDPGVQISTGTALWPNIFFGGSSFKGSIGGGHRNLNEKILKSGTTYVVMFESRAADNEVVMKFDWYMHTDKAH